MICDVTRETSTSPSSTGLRSPSSPTGSSTKRTVRWDAGKENKQLPARDPGSEEVIIDTVKKIGKDHRGRAPLSHQSVLEATTESYRTRRDGHKPSGAVTADVMAQSPEETVPSAETVTSLFLTVAGQVHSSERYRALFGGLGSHFLVEAEPEGLAPGSAAGPREECDRGVIEEVLGEILRKAFRDPDVRSACEADPGAEPAYSSDVPTWVSMRSKRKGSTSLREEPSSRSLSENGGTSAGMGWRSPERLEGISNGVRTSFEVIHNGGGDGTEPKATVPLEVVLGRADVDGRAEQANSISDGSILPAHRMEIANSTAGDKEAMSLVGGALKDQSEFKGLAEFILEGTLFSVVKDAKKEQRI
jgi:hypothetical protein